MKFRSKVIYIIAGEPSGDFIGSRLIKSLKLLDPTLKIMGVGGSLMEKEGIKSLFNIKQISLMGFLEVLPKIFKILKLINFTVDNIKKVRPDILITIDSPGFNLKVAKKVRKHFRQNIKLIHYVAPSVWAYKPNRAHKFAKIFNYLFCLLPFEPQYFLKLGLKTFFVGHPIVESEIANLVKNNKVNSNGYSLLDPAHKNKIVLLPGSRTTEVRRLLPLFIKVALFLKEKHPNLDITIATIPEVYDIVSKLSEKYKDITITQTTAEKYRSFLESRLAIAASGTVTLELALAKVNTVVAYKLNFLSTLLIYFMIKVKWVSLINIMANKTIFPEVLGYKCTVNKLIKVTNILATTTFNDTEINKILYELGYNNFIPSKKAAQLVIEIIRGKV